MPSGDVHPISYVGVSSRLIAFKVLNATGLSPLKQSPSRPHLPLPEETQSAQHEYEAGPERANQWQG